MQVFSYLKATIRGSRKLWVSVGLIVCLILMVKAQSRQDLEKQRRQKEAQIAELRAQLNVNTKEQKKTLSYLIKLENLIDSREENIGLLDLEINLLNKSIGQNSDVLEAMDRDIIALKKEYAQLAYFIYKNRSATNMLSFVFAAKSFSESYKRLAFIKYYKFYRNKQILLIQETEKSIAAKVNDLKEKQEQKIILLAKMDDEKKNLEGEEKEKSALAKNLKDNEGKLRKKLKQQQQSAARLDKAIKDIIEKEIALARKKAKEQAAKDKLNKPAVTTKTKPANTTTGSTASKVKPSLEMTPEMSKLTNDFAGNRGKLPWPVEKGVITEHFGEQPNPYIQNVMVYNNGVKIKTSEEAVARSVFNGEVSSIIFIPGAGKAVLIKHGSFFTVYAGLKSVYVKSGDKVDTKQTIGTVGKNAQSGDPEVELQIWDTNQKLNPENWLAK